MKRLLIAGLLLAGPALAAPDLAAVSKACGNAALQRGLFVEAITAFDESATAVAATMTFRATRKRLVCTYDLASRRVSLAEIGRYQLVPPEAETSRACKKAAERAGYGVRGLQGQEELMDKHGSPAARRVTLAAKKDRARWLVDCTYDFASKRVALAPRPE